MTSTTIETTTQLTDQPAETAGRHWLDLANQTQDPLECIAMALTGLLAVQVHAAEANSTDDLMATQLDASTETITELSNTLEAVRQAVGKSTASWADKIRTALGDTSTASGDPAPDELVEQPPRDADVEVWRTYARMVRSDLDLDLEQMNRSQIRTALGLGQA